MRRLSILFLLCITMAALARETSDLQRLTVFFTNDIHGGITPVKAEFLNPEFPPTLGNGAAAAAIVKESRENAEKTGGITLLIDGGDTFQGTVVGKLSEGLAVVEYMNRMQYDAVVVGNHEFDLGKDVLIRMIEESDFPWVCANIYDKERNQVWEYVKPWVITEKGGLKIGITGAITTGTEHMSFPDHVLGLEFRNEIECLRGTVAELKEQQVDLVVVLVHVGLPYDPEEGYKEMRDVTLEQALSEDHHVSAMEIARFVPDIDLLLGGHMHKGYREVWEDPVNHTICMQNYANGGNLGWLEVDIHQPTKSIAGYDYVADKNALILLQEDQFWPDSTMLAFLDEQQQQYASEYKEVIGASGSGLTRSSIGEGPLNNLICNTMCESTGADFAFMNFGGIRADLKSGPITREDVFKVLPFGNEIVSFQCSGKYLKRILERKLNGGGRGLSIGGGFVVFNKQLPDGERVTYVEIDGEPLDPDKTYRIATNDYLIEGNSGLTMLADLPRNAIDFTGIRLSEAVVEYISNNSPVEVKLDGRWKNDSSAQPSPEWQKKFSN